MPQLPRQPALLPGATPSAADALRAWLLHTLPGRALVLGVALKILVGLLGLALGERPAVLEAVDTVGGLALIFGGAYALARSLVWAKRSLLWRVRRKLILSYIFVGLVPGLLIISFFLLAGLLLFFNVSSYLVQTRIRTLTEQARFLAQSTLLEAQRATSAAALRETLDRRQAGAEERYPFTSIAIVPVRNLTCSVPPPSAARAPRAGLPESLPVEAGPWAHLDPPEQLPAWVGCDGFAGLIAYDTPPDEQAPGGRSTTRLAMRAAALPEVSNPTWAVVLDLPMTHLVEDRVRDEIGIRLGEVTALPFAQGAAALPSGYVLEGRAQDTGGTLVGPQWVAFLDYMDWASGAPANLTVAIQINVWEIYDRISSVSSTRLGSMSFGQVLLAVLALVGVLFLVIQFVALVIGFALARQITGAVHDLFTGTQHLRNRDFSHAIPVRARDQLGELADSFNQMTGEITTLLRENAEKERLEQELRTARDIQMKLLPQGPLRVPGLAVTAYCEPAREVGGDYYDFLPLGERKFGFLIADVSGKGTSAALYMAELKGLILSLSRIHQSPRDLLIAANRVIADHIDARSFITISYVVVDLDRREMTYARAGHCPLLYLPGPSGNGRRARVLAPDGLVLGLSLGDDGALFESLLEEVTLPLGPDDLVVLFTDGFSETMNETYDCFGEGRLGEIVEQYGDLPFDELREKIVAEVRAFAGPADQHDDMTMILLKVEALPAPALPAAG